MTLVEQTSENGFKSSKHANLPAQERLVKIALKQKFNFLLQLRKNLQLLKREQMGNRKQMPVNKSTLRLSVCSAWANLEIAAPDGFHGCGFDSTLGRASCVASRGTQAYTCARTRTFSSLMLPVSRYLRTMVSARC